MKKHKIKDWTITAIVERPDGTWYDHTITDFPEHIGITINEWLQDYKTTEEIMSEDMIECKVCFNVILICDDELKMQIMETL
jgi:hypothetical protein